MPNYVLPVPGTADDWLMIAFSVLDADGRAGQFAGLLIEVFDAMMSTFPLDEGLIPPGGPGR